MIDLSETRVQVDESPMHLTQLYMLRACLAWLSGNGFCGRAILNTLREGTMPNKPLIKAWYKLCLVQRKTLRCLLGQIKASNVAHISNNVADVVYLSVTPGPVIIFYVGRRFVGLTCKRRLERQWLFMCASHAYIRKRCVLGPKRSARDHNSQAKRKGKAN